MTQKDAKSVFLGGVTGKAAFGANQKDVKRELERLNGALLREKDTLVPDAELAQKVLEIAETSLHNPNGAFALKILCGMVDKDRNLLNAALVRRITTIAVTNEASAFVRDAAQNTLGRLLEPSRNSGEMAKAAVAVAKNHVGIQDIDIRIAVQRTLQQIVSKNQEYAQEILAMAGIAVSDPVRDVVKAGQKTRAAVIQNNPELANEALARGLARSSVLDSDADIQFVALETLKILLDKEPKFGGAALAEVISAHDNGQIKALSRSGDYYGIYQPETIMFHTIGNILTKCPDQVGHAGVARLAAEVMVAERNSVWDEIRQAAMSVDDINKPAAASLPTRTPVKPGISPKLG